MKVLLVDDHSLFLEGLKNLLNNNGYQVVGTARDGIEALAKARELRPELILMDIRMEGCDGLAATRLIKAELPDIKIVILTMTEKDEFLFEALRSGASGYLLKELDSDVFLSLLSGIAEGDPPLAPGMVSKIVKEFSRQPAGDNGGEGRKEKGLLIKDLTPRQRQIISLVARGLTYREIGDALVISESTVKNHMKNIFARLNLGSKAEVIAFARAAGLDKNID